MEKFQARKRFRRTLYSVPTLCLLLVIVIVFGRAVWGAYQKYSITDVNLKEAMLEDAAVLGRKETIEKQLGRLATDRGIEEEVRKNFQIAKPGEELLIIVDGTTSSPMATTTQPLSWWQKLKNFFR